MRILSEKEYLKEEDKSNILRLKCILVGDPAVGKTSMIQVFNNENHAFSKNYTMTCNVDLLVKSVQVPDTNTVVELYIYDSSGKEIYFETLNKLWYSASMLVLVYDVTNEMSFNSCLHWLEKVNAANPGINVPGILIGNKTDLKGRRVISPKSAQDFAKKFSLQYFECSSKEHQGVDEAFFFIVNEWHKLYLEKKEFFKNVS